MSDVALQFNSVAWELGNASPLDDPMIYGVTVDTRGKRVQLGSMRLSDLNRHVLRVLQKGPPKDEAPEVKP